jgi:hypothetical protein
MVVWDVTGINAAGERILAPHTERASGSARTDAGSSFRTTESGHEQPPPQISKNAFCLSVLIP